MDSVPMRFAAVDRIAPAEPFQRLPVELMQFPARRAAILVVLGVIPVIAAVIAPFGLVAALAAEKPAALSVMAERPLAAVQLVLGFLVGTVLVVVPVRQAVARLGRRRHIRIENDLITVTARGPFGGSNWCAPLSSFKGVAHHVRATLSGTRHELILVHPERRNSILIEIADRIAQSRLDQVAAVLGLPEIAASELYRSERPTHRPEQVRLAPAAAQKQAFC